MKLVWIVLLRHNSLKNPLIDGIQNSVVINQLLLTYRAALSVNSKYTEHTLKNYDLSYVYNEKILTKFASNFLNFFVTDLLHKAA